MSRENCIAAIDRALAADSDGAQDTTPLARAIEDAIHERNGNAADSARYKNDVRSKVHNIKTNAQLRHRLLDGTIDPAQVAAMSAEDMATREKRADNAAIRAESAEGAVMVNTLEGHQHLDDDLDTGIVRNTGQDGIEYDAP